MYDTFPAFGRSESCCAVVLTRLLRSKNHVRAAPKAIPTRGPITTPAIHVLLFVLVGVVVLTTGDDDALAVAAVEEAVVVEDVAIKEAGVAEDVVEEEVVEGLSGPIMLTAADEICSSNGGVEPNGVKRNTHTLSSASAAVGMFTFQSYVRVVVRLMPATDTVSPVTAT